MRISIVIKKIKRNLTDYGLLVTLKKSFSFPFQCFYASCIYRVYMINLDDFPLKEIERKDLTFCFIDKSHNDIIKQIEEIEEWLEGKLESKLKNHGICLVALDGNRVAGFNLVAFEKVYLPLIRFEKKLRKGKAWSEQITVHKDYRKRGLGVDLRYRIFAELKNRGIKKFYGGALLSNKPSLKLAEAAGFDFLVDIYYRKIFHLQTWRYKKVRK